MENITRKQIDRIIKILRENTAVYNANEKNKLALMLEKVDILPKLYQAAYVESLYNIFSKCKSLEEFKEKFKWSFYDEKTILENKDSFQMIKNILSKSHERQNEICDFEDSTLDQHSIGKCKDENHYEDIEYQQFLTDEGCKKFKIINEEKGWFEACEYFQDKLNSDKQKLTLILNFSNDETKVMKDDGYYVCDNCLDILQGNSEGNISCDLEMADHNE